MVRPFELDALVTRRAAQQHGLITRRDALDVGLSSSAISRRLDAHRWLALEPGVYLIQGSPVTWYTKVLAACFATGGFASHRSSAVLHEVWGYRPGHPEVTVPRGRRPRSTGALIHQSVDADRARLIRVNGIPTTDAARLAVDLGSVSPFRQYERAMDDLLGRELVTWDDLLHTLMAHAARGRSKRTRASATGSSWRAGSCWSSPGAW